MTVLKDYQQFDGLHWETGSVRNYWDYRGVKAPHSGQPYSEAMLLGVSGGIVMGYFSFAYEGYDPHARILTRNTFDPLDRMLERLGVVQHLRQTSEAGKAELTLLEALEEGTPAIVWADMFSLPYNALPQDAGMWGMLPLLVYGYDTANDRAWIADRARVPLNVSTAELAAARGRVKNNKYRLLLLDPPDEARLATAVRKGIWDCIQLFIEAPPKGSRNNFGLQAYRWWSELLLKPKARLSWEREFPAGIKMYAGLTNAFGDINTFGKDGHAERDVYAGFLEEARLVLDKPALQDAAAIFRRSAAAWDELSLALLPDRIDPFKETRELMLHRQRLYLEQGGVALDEIQQINARLADIRLSMASDFPLDSAGVTAMRQQIARCVLKIHDIEKEALEVLQEAVM